jgi:hypothetical protein
MSSSPIASFTAPFTLTTTQNGSVLTPFDLWCTPSPPRRREPHKFQIFPVVVNSATAGVHYRSTGSGDPLVPLSLSSMRSAGALRTSWVPPPSQAMIRAALLRVTVCRVDWVTMDSCRQTSSTPPPLTPKCSKS